MVLFDAAALHVEGLEQFLMECLWRALDVTLVLLCHQLAEVVLDAVLLNSLLDNLVGLVEAFFVDHPSRVLVVIDHVCLGVDKVLPSLNIMSLILRL